MIPKRGNKRAEANHLLSVRRYTLNFTAGADIPSRAWMSCRVEETEMRIKKSQVPGRYRVQFWREGSDAEEKRKKAHKSAIKSLLNSKIRVYRMKFYTVGQGMTGVL